MPRLIILISFALLLGAVASLVSFKKMKVFDGQWDFKTLENTFKEKQKLMEELALKHTPGKASHGGSDSDIDIEALTQISLDSDELKLGHVSYHKTGKCITCHGVYGEGKKSQLAPRLAGQKVFYLEQQLLDMKNLKRVNEKMQPYLNLVTTEEMKAIAVYLSALPPWPLEAPSP